MGRQMIACCGLLAVDDDSEFRIPMNECVILVLRMNKTRHVFWKALSILFLDGAPSHNIKDKLVMCDVVLLRILV